MNTIKYTLYWEDVQRRILITTLAERSWTLAEELFGYTKEHSLYIYQHEKLAAFYSNDDVRVEADRGYSFFKSRANVDRVIAIKKHAHSQMMELHKGIENSTLGQVSDTDLHALLLSTCNVFIGGLSAHYLTQPQFFERFEAHWEEEYATLLHDLAGARFRYSKRAWIDVVPLLEAQLHEYSKRYDISTVEAESLTYDELCSKHFIKVDLIARIEQFAVVSKNHACTIHAAQEAQPYIDFYGQYLREYTKQSGEGTAKGVIGNHGIATGLAFVIDSAHYDVNNKPRGMQKGMILIVQNAWPELVEYYAKAAAIVTNEGGITSHGVVVSRELGIPCVVGTKIGTKIIRAGDMVEVNAYEGTVRVLAAARVN